MTTGCALLRLLMLAAASVHSGSAMASGSDSAAAAAAAAAAGVSAKPQQPQPQEPPPTHYLLPRRDPRCKKVEKRLMCIDQSVLVAATARPDQRLLDEMVICDSVVWAPISCKREETSGLMVWQLAFLVTQPRCGDRVVVNSSIDSKVSGQGNIHWQIDQLVSTDSVTFGCDTHAYPYLHRPRFKFARIFWHNGAPKAAADPPVSANVSIHLYAVFRPGVRDRQQVCRGSGSGFWCHRGNATCVYLTHRCNGYDDCLDADPAASDLLLLTNGTSRQLSSDEENCAHEHHHHGQLETAGAEAERGCHHLASWERCCGRRLVSGGAVVILASWLMLCRSGFNI